VGDTANPDTMGHAAGCVFCEIASDGTDADVFYRSGRVIAFQPLHPAALGHTLLVPTVHRVDVLDLEPDLAAEMAAATVSVGRALREVLTPDGMNVITSAGAAATQTVFHLHVHLVPRWWGDPMGDFWPRGTATGTLDAHRAAQIGRLAGGAFT
jgi:histidine triad (HIT) family protein